jgi:hypothetical protein
MSKYRARKNAKISNKEAEKIGRFIEKIFPNRQYTPYDIISVAEPKNSPIHKYFDWNDKSAAAKYRVEQARDLIQCIVQITKTGDEIPLAVSVVVCDEDGNTHRTYMDTRRAVENIDSWGQVMEDAIQGLQSWRFRFQMLKGFEEMNGAFKYVDNSIKIINKTLTKRKENNFDDKPPTRSISAKRRVG